MADVSSDLKNWSTTAASNNPTDSTVISSGLADNFQQLQATVRQDLASKGADIASASTTDLGAVPGLFHDITGTTTITSFGTVAEGIWKVIKFENTLTLTHNATSLILPTGANITTANGDVAIVSSEGGGNWRCHSYMRASGQPIATAVSVASLATSGNATVSGTLIASGNATVAGTLGVTGTTSLSNVTVSGNATVSGTLIGSGNMTVAGTGLVTGTLTSSTQVQATNDATGDASTIFRGFATLARAGTGNDSYLSYTVDTTNIGAGSVTWITGVDESVSGRPFIIGMNGIGIADKVTLSSSGNMTVTGNETILSATAIPAGGTVGQGYKFSSTTNFGVFFGSGAPSLSAAKGSLYLRSDGSTTNDRMYVNTNGGTTWTAVTTVA